MIFGNFSSHLVLPNEDVPQSSTQLKNKDKNEPRELVKDAKVPADHSRAAGDCAHFIMIPKQLHRKQQHKGKLTERMNEKDRRQREKTVSGQNNKKTAAANNTAPGSKQAFLEALGFLRPELDLKD